MKRCAVLGICLGVCAVLALGWTSSVGAQGGSWGTVKGRILWGDKQIPASQEIETVKKHADMAVCLKNGPVMSEKWVVNKKNNGLRWTFVWLADANKNPLPVHPDLKEIKQKDIVMDQPLCLFVPHAIAMREGQNLIAKNSASIPHNFKWSGRPGTPNEGNNVLIPAGGKLPIKGLVADRLPVKIECNIHPWMNGWVRLYDHPYFAVTDADGKFEIKDAPAGDYRLIVWHGSGGWLGGAKGKDGKAINIKAGAATDLGDIDYPPPAD